METTRMFLKFRLIMVSEENGVRVGMLKAKIFTRAAAPASRRKLRGGSDKPADESEQSPDPSGAESLPSSLSVSYQAVKARSFPPSSALRAYFAPHPHVGGRSGAKVHPPIFTTSSVLRHDGLFGGTPRLFAVTPPHGGQTLLELPEAAHLEIFLHLFQL